VWCWLWEYVPSLQSAVAPVGSVLEAVLAAGAEEAVAAALLVALGVAGGAVATLGAAGVLVAALPVHSATPPCPLQAPFFEALVVYEPSLHFPVASAGGAEGAACAALAVALFSDLAFAFSELALP